MCAPQWGIPRPLLTTFRHQHRTFQSFVYTGSECINACYDVCTTVGYPSTLLTTFRQQHRTFQPLVYTGSHPENACYDVCTIVGYPSTHFDHF